MVILNYMGKEYFISQNHIFGNEVYDMKYIIEIVINMLRS